MTFRSELARYRQRLLSENQDGPCERRHIRLAVEILDRWRDHAEVEQVWDTLKAALPADAMPTEEEFITIVLNRSLLWNRVADVVRELPGAKSRYRSNITRLWRTDDYMSATIKRFVSGKYLNLCNRLCNELLGRKRAVQTRFMRSWASQFRELCGNPLTEVVRVLTEVAFGGDITPQAVRDSKKATTLRGRKTFDH